MQPIVQRSKTPLRGYDLPYGNLESRPPRTTPHPHTQYPKHGLLIVIEPYISFTLQAVLFHFSLSLETLCKKPPSSMIQHEHFKQSRRSGRYGRQEVRPLARRGRWEDPSKRGRGYPGRGGPDQRHAEGTIQQPPPLLHRQVSSTIPKGYADRACRNTRSDPRHRQRHAHRQRRPAKASEAKHVRSWRGTCSGMPLQQRARRPRSGCTLTPPPLLESPC